jgi:hypothetical protein
MIWSCPFFCKQSLSSTLLISASRCGSISSVEIRFRAPRSSLLHGSLGLEQQGRTSPRTRDQIFCSFEMRSLCCNDLGFFESQ